MAERIWVIYKHTNKVNGKSYIGQTCTPTKVRWQSGYGYTKKCQAFRSALDKYGWENFDHEIIEENITSIEQANEREKYWIAYYHTYLGDPQCHGYNMTPGGGASDTVRQTIEKDGLYQKVFVCELPRYEADGWRVVPVKEVKKLYYQAHKEELYIKRYEYQVNYRREHREEIAAKNKKYAEENREKVKAKQREWMAKNPERIKAQKAAWAEAHKEEQKEKKRQYYLANRERLIQHGLEYQRKYQQRKKEEKANEKSTIN